MITRTLQKLHLLQKPGRLLGAEPREDLGGIQTQTLERYGPGAVGVALEDQQLVALAMIDAAERRPHADGPGHGIAADPENFLDLIHEAEGIATLAVHFVDERQHGCLANGANL